MATELRRKGQNHLNDSVMEISQNTEKLPGDPKRLAVTQIPVLRNKRMGGDHSDNRFLDQPEY